MKGKVKKGLLKVGFEYLKAFLFICFAESMSSEMCDCEANLQ